jgi:predicted DNA-binding WGR domain protein
MPAQAVRARRFEFIAGTSSKFWQIAVTGKEVVVRFGRIGTEGQATTKTFPDEAAVERHTTKVIKEKLSKGYVAVS